MRDTKFKRINRFFFAFCAQQLCAVEIIKHKERYKWADNAGILLYPTHSKNDNQFEK